MTRKLLNCTSAYDIVDTIYNHKRGAAANYMVAHAEGFLINFETTPDACDYLEPENGWLAHTNHFISPRFRMADTGVRISGDSFPRLQRAQRLLAKHQGHVDESVVKAILRDQYFAPFGICTCPDPNAPEMDRWSTLSSVIYDLEEMCMWISHGNPSEMSYEVFSMEATHDFN